MLCPRSLTYGGCISERQLGLRHSVSPSLTYGGCISERQLGLRRLPDEVAERMPHQLPAQAAQHLAPAQLVTQAGNELLCRRVCDRKIHRGGGGKTYNRFNARRMTNNIKKKREAENRG